jgi:hypothetical protein
VTDQPRITTASDFPDQATIHLPEYTFWDSQAGACEVGVPDELLPGLRDAIDTHLNAHASERPAPAPACGEECAEGHTYAGRCALYDPTACTWPDCLSDGQQAELAEQVRAAELGQPTTPMPDQRQTCGCRDKPTATCPAATWAGLTVCVTCPTPEPGTACAREPDALLRAATARTTPDNPAASNNRLRDRYAAAIWERQNPGRHWADCEHPWQADAEADADAVMAVRDRHMQQLTAGRATWKAKAEEIERDRDRLADSDARIRQLADRWGNALAPDRRYAEALLAALDGPADTSTPAEDPPEDTCWPVQVDGETIRVHGARPLTGVELGHAAQVVAAARRKLAAEPPVVPDDDGTESALTRRIRAQQRGLVLPAVEPPGDSVPPVPCPACTRARARGFTVDALAHPGCADTLATQETQ